MGLKRPTHRLSDQVRITREGGDAIIDHADANVSGARMVIGPYIASMSNADIVEDTTRSSTLSGGACSSRTDSRRRTTG
jgi:hypothetical protein